MFMASAPGHDGSQHSSFTVFQDWPRFTYTGFYLVNVNCITVDQSQIRDKI